MRAPADGAADADDADDAAARAARREWREGDRVEALRRDASLPQTLYVRGVDRACDGAYELRKVPARGERGHLPQLVRAVTRAVDPAHVERLRQARVAPQTLDAVALAPLAPRRARRGVVGVVGVGRAVGGRAH